MCPFPNYYETGLQITFNQRQLSLLLPNGGEVTKLFMDYQNRLVAFGYDFRKKPQLLVWQMSGQGKFTLIHQQSLERLGGVVRYVEMDDQYVVITVLYELKQSIYFLSNNTLKIEGSLNDIPIDDSYVYGSGLLFHFQRDCIR